MKEQRYSNSEKMLDAIGDELDRSCDRLNGHTLSRLNRIRHEALERSRASNRRSLLAPFGGLVTACCLLVIILSVINRQDLPDNVITVPNTAIEDLEILTAEESLEFYQDYEFYQWLAENDTSV